MNQQFKPRDTFYYMIDMFCFGLGLFSFLLAFYVMPYAFLGLLYDIPEFLLNMMNSIGQRYHLMGLSAAFGSVLPFFLLGLFFLIVSSRITNTIERKALHIEKAQLNPELRLPLFKRHSTLLFLEVVLIAGGMGLVIYLLDWFLS